MLVFHFSSPFVFLFHFFLLALCHSLLALALPLIDPLLEFSSTLLQGQKENCSVDIENHLSHGEHPACFRMSIGGLSPDLLLWSN